MHYISELHGTEYHNSLSATAFTKPDFKIVKSAIMKVVGMFLLMMRKGAN